jgi:acyl carrier protein
MSKRLYSIISKVMDVPISEINDESSPESIESWDSFNSYVLLDELETEFKTEFSIDEVVETKNVADIKKYLKKHGIELND